MDADEVGIKLLDSPAFGTGLHPTTALCLEALDEMVPFADSCVLLDVGTGSGVLALGALVRRVDRTGVLILSGVADSLQEHVTDAYRRLGMRVVTVTSRAGWSAIILRASW